MAEETGNYEPIGKFDSRNPASFYNGILFITKWLLYILSYFWIYIMPWIGTFPTVFFIFYVPWINAMLAAVVGQYYFWFGVYKMYIYNLYWKYDYMMGRSQF